MALARVSSSSTLSVAIRKVTMRGLLIIQENTLYYGVSTAKCYLRSRNHCHLVAKALTQRAKPLMLNSSGNLFFFTAEGSPVLHVRVFYHDKCFDGACSASLFTRFHRECIDNEATYDYHGLVHRAGALFDESEFTGDENAIVDFKYSSSDRITWWFDHHLSAFLTPEDQQHFERCQQDPACAARKFFDPDYTSCTSFLAHIGKTRFGFDTAPVAELIRWADIVDGAQYESP